MIDLYSGTPGSGKSLHCAFKLYYRIKLHHSVIANFEINLNAICKHTDNFHFYYVPNWDLTPDYLVDFSRQYFGSDRVREDEILLVLDECQLLFNAREWQKQGRESWLSFFTQHRKYGYHVILIAQFDRMIDRQIRSLIEYEYVHRKLSNFGIKGKILSLVMGGNTFVSVQIWYPLKEKVGSEFFHARKKFYRLYDSYGQFSLSSEDAEKTSTDGAGD